MAPKKPTANGRDAASRAAYTPPEETDTVFALDSRTGEPVRTKRKGADKRKANSSAAQESETARYDEAELTDTVLEAGPESTEGWAAKADQLVPPASFTTVFSADGDQPAPARDSSHAASPTNVVYTPPQESGTLWEVRPPPKTIEAVGNKSAGRNVVVVVVVVLIIAMVVAAIVLDPLSIRNSDSGTNANGADNTAPRNGANESEPINAPRR